MTHPADNPDGTESCKHLGRPTPGCLACSRILEGQRPQPGESDYRTEEERRPLDFDETQRFVMEVAGKWPPPPRERGA